MFSSGFGRRSRYNGFEEVKMLSILPENCKSLNAVKHITSNKLSEMYTDIIKALKILQKTVVSGFGAKFVLETKTYGKLHTVND
jgi:hypothetical protein